MSDDKFTQREIHSALTLVRRAPMIRHRSQATTSKDFRRRKILTSGATIPRTTRMIPPSPARNW